MDMKKKCPFPGCDVDIHIYATACKLHRIDKGNSSRVVPEVPRRPPRQSSYKPPTDAQQRKIDRMVDERVNARAGLVMDKGRRLTAAEIARIASEITPIQEIRHRDYSAGWVV